MVGNILDRKKKEKKISSLKILKKERGLKSLYDIISFDDFFFDQWNPSIRTTNQKLITESACSFCLQVKFKQTEQSHEGQTFSV